MKSVSSSLMFFVAMGVFLSGCEKRSPEPEPELKVHATIRDLMDSIIDPSADIVWDSFGTVIDKSGTHELAPKNDEEWAKIRRATIAIVEGANLLMMKGRRSAALGQKSAAPGDELEPEQVDALIKANRPIFDGFARALQEVALEALRAAEAKNAPAFIDIGGRLDNVCESCHITFWYPKQRLPKDYRGHDSQAASTRFNPDLYVSLRHK